jgi:hypothetical protein
MPVNDAYVARTTARRARVLELRKAGASYREISEQVHASLRTVWRDVRVELRKLAEETRDTTEVFRAMEMQRLDRLQLSYWPNAVGFTDKDGKPHPASVKAAEIVLRIMEQRAKLLGLNAPTLVEVGGSMEVVQVFQQAQLSLAKKLADLPIIDITPALAALSTGGDSGNGRH